MTLVKRKGNIIFELNINNKRCNLLNICFNIIKHLKGMIKYENI